MLTGTMLTLIMIMKLQLESCQLHGGTKKIHGGTVAHISHIFSQSRFEEFGVMKDSVLRIIRKFIFPQSALVSSYFVLSTIDIYD